MNEGIAQLGYHYSTISEMATEHGREVVVAVAVVAVVVVVEVVAADGVVAESSRASVGNNGGSGRQWQRCYSDDHDR